MTLLQKLPTHQLYYTICSDLKNHREYIKKYNLKTSCICEINAQIINKFFYQNSTLFIILTQFWTILFLYKLCVTEKRKTLSIGFLFGTFVTITHCNKNPDVKLWSNIIYQTRNVSKKVMIQDKTRQLCCLLLRVA